jgi:hypothetical protein
MNFRQVVPNIRDDESIYVFVRPHWLSFLPWLGLGLGLVIIGITVVISTFFVIPEITANPLTYDIFIIMSAAFFLIIIPFITVAFIDIYYDVHIVTSRRLVDIDQHNLFMREISELALEEVQDVNCKSEGVFAALFDFGMVEIATSASHMNFEFDNVPHPQQIAGIILDLADQAKTRIEGMNTAMIEPRGEEKGMINGQLYTSFEELEKIGARVPQSTRSTSSLPLSTLSSVKSTTTKTVEVAGIPIEKEEDDTIKPNSSSLRQSSSPALPSQVKSALETQSKNKDLEIVIDEPINHRPEKK